MTLNTSLTNISTLSALWIQLIFKWRDVRSSQDDATNSNHNGLSEHTGSIVMVSLTELYVVIQTLLSDLAAPGGLSWQADNEGLFKVFSWNEDLNWWKLFLFRLQLWILQSSSTSGRDHLPCHNDVQTCSAATREKCTWSLFALQIIYLFGKYERGSGRDRIPNIVPDFYTRILYSWLRKLLLWNVIYSRWSSSTCRRNTLPPTSVQKICLLPHSWPFLDQHVFEHEDLDSTFLQNFCDPLQV